MKIITPTFLFLLLKFSVLAQNMTFKGQISDVKMESVSFATIHLELDKQQSFDKIADKKGQFSLEIPSSSVYKLKVSSVGYMDIVFQFSKIPSKMV